jgi:hypothetical protein
MMVAEPLIHVGRGQASNHRLNTGVREYAIELVRTRYADFGPTLVMEILLDKHAIKVGRETLRLCVRPGCSASYYLLNLTSIPDVRGR